MDERSSGLFTSNKMVLLYSAHVARETVQLLHVNRRPAAMHET